MLLRAKFIGIGAAGNKAVIELIEKGVARREEVMILNSTLKDVPVAYRDIAIEFEDATGGCGKERDLAKELALKSLRSGYIPMDSLMEPTDNTLIIATSTEGSTGCGAATVIAKYAKDVLGINVNVFAFAGFEEDGRGLQNTIEFFQELQDNYSVQCISNKKFLAEVNGNKLKAEKAANVEFAKKITILLGQQIVDSVQNIDETDLYKVSVTPGFTDIEYAILDKIKNVEAFNKVVVEMIDGTKSLDFEPTAQRLAVILNISEKTQDYIDYSFKIIKEKVGVPYEVFTHIQNEGDVEYIAIIASGLKMPIDDVTAIYEKYKRESSKVDKSKDAFFNFANELRGNEEDSRFNNSQTKGHVKKIDTADKRDFFGSFGMEDPSLNKGGIKGQFGNTNVAKVITATQETDKTIVNKY